MQYRTVFDVTMAGFQLCYALPAFVFAGVFVLVGWGIKTLDEPYAQTKGFLFQAFGVLAWIGVFTFFVAMCAQYYTLRKALSTHDYSIAQGVVTNFVPMPKNEHALESFTVDGVRFVYGGGWGSITFNSQWNKGFIHDGVKSRITYRGTDIIKVEVQAP